MKPPFLTSRYKDSTPYEDLKTTTLIDWINYLYPLLMITLISLFSALIFIFLPTEPSWRALYMIIIIILSWLINYMDIVIVSFFPLIYGTLLILLPTSTIMTAYFTTTTLLYVTASMVGGAFQKVGLDKRFALFMMRGSSHTMFDITWRYIVVAGFISMWIANTAAMTLLIPILQKMLDLIGEYKQKMRDSGIKDPRVFKPPESRLTARELQVTSYLVMANSTSVGGMVTLIGSTTNMAFLGQWEGLFPCENPVTFLLWMIYSFPMAFFCFYALWITSLLSWEGPVYVFKLHVYFFHAFINKVTGKNPNKGIPGVKEYFEASDNALEKMPPWSFSEYMLTAIFIIIPLLLITREPGIGGISGWDYFFKGFTNDSMVTAFFAILVFMLPRYSFGEIKKAVHKDPQNGSELKKNMLKEKLIQWHEATKSVEWGVMWIFGGGFAMATIIVETGLSKIISDSLKVFYESTSEPVAVLVTLTIASILTEFMSATNVAQVLTVILTEAALGSCINPLLLSMNAVNAAASGTLFPISTPPHVLAYKAANVTIPQMWRTGLLFKISSVIIIYASIYIYGIPLMSFDKMPDWANCFTGDPALRPINSNCVI